MSFLSSSSPGFYSTLAGFLPSFSTLSYYIFNCRSPLSCLLTHLFFHLGSMFFCFPFLTYSLVIILASIHFTLIFKEQSYIYIFIALILILNFLIIKKIFAVLLPPFFSLVSSFFLTFFSYPFCFLPLSHLFTIFTLINCEL